MSLLVLLVPELSLCNRIGMLL